MQVIQVAIADFLQFQETELGNPFSDEGIFEGLSVALQEEVVSYLNVNFFEYPDRDKFDADYVIESAIQFFLNVEATSFDDPELTEEPIRTELRQIGVLRQYLGNVQIAA